MYPPRIVLIVIVKTVLLYYEPSLFNLDVKWQAFTEYQMYVYTLVKGRLCVLRLDVGKP